MILGFNNPYYEETCIYIDNQHVLLVSMICSDINECDTNKGDCESGYMCENTIGSFSCVGKSLFLIGT